jgi:TolB protein
MAGALVSAGAAVFVAPAEAAFPGRNGVVGYASESADNACCVTNAIVVVGPDGHGERVLRRCRRELPSGILSGDCSISYASPAWSPSGKRLAFDAGVGLALVDGNGGHFRLLSPVTRDDGEPAWSPDGSRLVLTGPGPNLWVLRPGTGARRRLTYRGGSQAAWSSKGRIAYVRRRSIYLVRPSGGGLPRLTRRGGSAPDWSPHGAYLAFLRDGAAYIVRASGRGLRRVATDGAHPFDQVVWSPDGRYLVVGAADSGLYVIRASDGRRVTTLETNVISPDMASVEATDPDWQPLP